MGLSPFDCTEAGQDGVSKHYGLIDTDVVKYHYMWNTQKLFLILLLKAILEYGRGLHEEEEAEEVKHILGRIIIIMIMTSLSRSNQGWSSYFESGSEFIWNPSLNSKKQAEITDDFNPK